VASRAAVSACAGRHDETIYHSAGAEMSGHVGGRAAPRTRSVGFLARWWLGPYPCIVVGGPPQYIPGVGSSPAGWTGRPTRRHPGFPVGPHCDPLRAAATGPHAMNRRSTTSPRFVHHRIGGHPDTAPPTTWSPVVCFSNPPSSSSFATPIMAKLAEINTSRRPCRSSHAVPPCRVISSRPAMPDRNSVSAF